MYENKNSISDEPFGCLVFLLVILMVVMIISLYLFGRWYDKYKDDDQNHYQTETYINK